MTEPGPTDNRTYITYREDLEEPRPDEQQLIAKIIDALRGNNERAFKKYKHAIRDAHAKSHGVLRGELRVLPDLPEHLRQGIFAAPTTYPVIARLSTTSGALRSDQVRGVRGLAIKVLDVHGRRLVPGDDATTQDFVFVNHAEFPFKDVYDYSRKGMLTAKALARTPDPVLLVSGALLRGAKRVLSVFGAKLPYSLELFAEPNTLTLGETFYTAAPLRYGKYVAKLSVAPLSKSVKDLTGKTLSSRDADAHTKAVVDFFGHNSAEYVVSAQLCTDTTRMPIEDAAKAWPEELSPYCPVATISYPVQDAYSPERQVFGDDVLSFNSWRAIEDHRPLGSINRLKREVYDASSWFRHDKNKVAQLEPRTIADLPQ
jgi:hypothetical protein